MNNFKIKRGSILEEVFFFFLVATLGAIYNKIFWTERKSDRNLNNDPKPNCCQRSGMKNP